MTSRSIGPRTKKHPLRFISEVNVTSGVSSVEIVWPGLGSNIYSPDQIYDLVQFRFYNVEPASTGVWFQMAMNYSITGGSYTAQPIMHTLTVADTQNSSNTKWTTGGHSGQGSENNRRNTTTNSDSLRLVYVGNGTSISNCTGYMNFYNGYGVNNKRLGYHGYFIGDRNDSTERAYQYWPHGYINDNNRQGRIKFQMSSGNIDNAIIKMYGIRSS